MTQVTRLNDLGQGNCYVGHPDVPPGSPKPFITTFIKGADTVFLNNEPIIIIGSLGVTDCGHTTMAVSGSSSVFAENMAVHRLNDIGVINEGSGEYYVISDSDDVAAGG
jgi:hypothetical protein